jgi:hypothetical protein
MTLNCEFLPAPVLICAVWQNDSVHAANLSSRSSLKLPKAAWHGTRPRGPSTRPQSRAPSDSLRIVQVKGSCSEFSLRLEQSQWSRAGEMQCNPEHNSSFSEFSPGTP